MMSGECGRCCSEFEIPSGGEGTFTSISVSYHDDDRQDWAESYCPECADDILGDAVPADIRRDGR